MRIILLKRIAWAIILCFVQSTSWSSSDCFLDKEGNEWKQFGDFTTFYPKECDLRRSATFKPENKENVKEIFVGAYEQNNYRINIYLNCDHEEIKKDLESSDLGEWIWPFSSVMRSKPGVDPKAFLDKFVQRGILPEDMSGHIINIIHSDVEEESKTIMKEKGQYMKPIDETNQIGQRTSDRFAVDSRFGSIMTSLRRNRVKPSKNKHLMFKTISMNRTYSNIRRAHLE